MTHRIVIEAVPREKMRPPYDQEELAGDWFWRQNGQDRQKELVIRVTGRDVLGKRQILFALHELVEAVLCLDAGITPAQVDTFDEYFAGEGEPGDAEECPYQQQHRRALLVEFLMADWLGIKGYGKME